MFASLWIPKTMSISTRSSSLQLSGAVLEMIVRKELGGLELRFGFEKTHGFLECTQTQAHGHRRIARVREKPNGATSASRPLTSNSCTMWWKLLSDGGIDACRLAT